MALGSNLLHVNSPENLKKFNDNYKKKEYVSLVYSESCGACMELEPRWLKVESILNNSKSKVPIVKVESNYLNDTELKNLIKHVPTILRMKNNRLVNYYHGDRSVEDILKYIKDVENSMESTTKSVKPTKKSRKHTRKSRKSTRKSTRKTRKSTRKSRKSTKKSTRKSRKVKRKTTKK